VHNLASLTLNQLQPMSGSQATELSTARLIRPNVKSEYLAVLPSRDARVIASARVESSVCWIYGWTRRLTVPAVLALMHALRRGSGDTMEACVHRMLYCSAVQSSVDDFALRTLA
jgi:hypothetical protein